VDKTVEQAVERAIAAMHDKLGEPVTVDDIAQAAMFSKFHFTRVFQRATGLSPGRFLSAIRIQRAKQLLVSTDLNVADISFLVGFNSVGTFSSRFSRSVGMSPTLYRKQGGFAAHIPAPAETWPEPAADSPGPTVAGVVSAHAEDRGGPVFIGLFPGRLPEGAPIRSTLLPHPGGYRLPHVPPGSWYVHAHRLAAAPEDFPPHGDPYNEPVAVGSRGPIVIGGGLAVKYVDVALKPARIMDPPVLLALLDARKMGHGAPGQAGPTLDKAA
jgi:AraC family transcriptional regulator